MKAPQQQRVANGHAEMTTNVQAYRVMLCKLCKQGWQKSRFLQKKIGF